MRMQASVRVTITLLRTPRYLRINTIASIDDQLARNHACANWSLCQNRVGRTSAVQDSAG